MRLRQTPTEAFETDTEAKKNQANSNQFEEVIDIRIMVLGNKDEYMNESIPFITITNLVVLLFIL